MKLFKKYGKNDNRKKFGFFFSGYILGTYEVALILY